MVRTVCATLLLLGVSTLAPGQQSKASIASLESLIRSQQYDQALETIRSDLRQTPSDFRLWTLKGIVLSIKGSNHDAIDAFQKALSFSPNYPAALMAEVQILYQARDKRAVPLLERILKADPKDQTAHEMLANLEEKQGSCEAAIDHFLLSAEAISTHPGSLEAYGNCLVQTKQPQKAIPIFEQLAGLLPQSTYPKYDLAVLLVEAKKNDAALTVLEPLLTPDQSDPDILSLSAQAYEAVGDTPKAATFLRQAIVLNPANADYYVTFATLCLDHDSFQVGIDMMNAGLSRIPNDPSLFISRGLLYGQLAEFDKAEADFNSAERLDEKQSISLYAKDIVEGQRDMSDESPSDKALSISEVRAQLKAHPDSAFLHFLLAKMLRGQQSETGAKAPGEAIRHALLAVKLKPDLVQARDLLASMYIGLGQYHLAIEQCRLALQYSPSDQSALYHLILALRHSGQSGQRDEIQVLVKRLSHVQQSALQQETEKKRFKLVEQSPEPAQ